MKTTLVQISVFALLLTLGTTAIAKGEHTVSKTITQKWCTQMPYGRNRDIDKLWSEANAKLRSIAPQNIPLKVLHAKIDVGDKSSKVCLVLERVALD